MALHVHKLIAYESRRCSAPTVVYSLYTIEYIGVFGRSCQYRLLQRSIRVSLARNRRQPFLQSPSELAKHLHGAAFWRVNDIILYLPQPTPKSRTSSSDDGLSDITQTLRGGQSSEGHESHKVCIFLMIQQKTVVHPVSIHCIQPI